jgi:hypothetical protein
MTANITDATAGTDAVPLSGAELVRRRFPDGMSDNELARRIALILLFAEEKLDLTPSDRVGLGLVFRLDRVMRQALRGGLDIEAYKILWTIRTGTWPSPTERTTLQ